MINTGKIYKITNKINNLIYVGCTTKSLKKRFREHVARSKSQKYNSKLYNSINKYGHSNFIIELVEECVIDDLYNLETQFIKEFDTFNAGLNSTMGGEGCIGYKHTEEAKLKCQLNSKQIADFRRGKTYEEIYGETNAVVEKEKRSESLSLMWQNLSEDDNVKRRLSSMITAINKAGYTADMILNIRELHASGVKPRHILQSFPELNKQDITNILDKRHFKLIHLLIQND